MEFTSLALRHYISTKMRRIGTITTLSTIMVFSLAACGTPSTAVQPGATENTPIVVQTEATPTTESTQPAVSTAPAAVSTERPDTAMGETPVVPDAVATGSPETESMDRMDMTPSASDPGTSATPTPAGQGGPGTATSTEIKGTLKEWAITLSQSEVAAGTIRFVVTNEGQFTHNFTITDSNGKIAGTSNFGRADGEQIIEVDLAPGTYSIICDLPGHAARGQKTELVVK
jgi:hypothetical protein